MINKVLVRSPQLSFGLTVGKNRGLDLNRNRGGKLFASKLHLKQMLVNYSRHFFPARMSFVLHFR